MKVAWTLGLRVPQDLSIAGFDDDVFFTSVVDVALTTGGSGRATHGARVAELLIERIQGYDGAAREEALARFAKGA